MNDDRFGSVTPVPTLAAHSSAADVPGSAGVASLSLRLDSDARPGAGFADKLWRFFACNPFYLLSAALLLYSFYLVSADPNFLRSEVAKLTFNLSSLQVYEILLVVTAIFLARRAVWYDSTLLVGLESLLVLVPFILVSQAALIDAKLVWMLCAAAFVLAAGRTAVVKRLIPELNLSLRSLGIGAVFLTVNAVLPVVYRVLHESKYGTKPDWGAAFETNQYLWWLLLPALCASFLFVRWKEAAGELWPQRRWLPAALVSVWLVGTGVHLYCLGYVYDFDLRPELLAPAVWVLLWVAWLRTAHLLPGLAPGASSVAMALPCLATLLAAPQPGKGVFLALTLANVGILGWIYFARKRRIALHLVLASLLGLMAGMPEEWGRQLAAGFDREKLVFGCLAIYVLVVTAISRNARLGILGGVLAAVVQGYLAPEPEALHWAIQAGLVFLLLHSLRWVNLEEGEKLVRWVAAVGWVAHAMLWMHSTGGNWAVAGLAVLVLAVCAVYRWLQGRWAPLVIPTAATLVLLAGPVETGIAQLNSAPLGLLAVIGSFLLFGLGTAAALTKPKWVRHLRQGQFNH